MRAAFLIGNMISLTSFLPLAWADEAGITKPNLVFNEVLSNFPKTDMDEVRVFTASFNPGDRTVTHTHRFPVTAYVLEGSFTLELKGKQPSTINSGQAFVVPPNTEMTGFNHSADKMLKVVIFYVSAPGTPFLDLVK